MAAERHEGRESRQYSGGVRNLLRDGFGVYVYPNSFFRYEGQWRMGKKHGRGKFIMKDGSFYEGDFVDGEIEGNGVRYWARTGDSYSGQFHCGELHGFGVMEYGSGHRYEGQFSYGLREGHGVLLDKVGRRYEGSFHENKKHGEGKMKFRNGDRYEGDWLLDQRQGHGVMRYRNGSVYEGQWRNNLFNGQGKMTHSSGVVCEGLWMNGRLCSGASHMEIEEGDMLEVLEGSPFTVNVHLEGHSGFEVISYPLMERAFESNGPRSVAPPSPWPNPALHGQTRQSPKGSRGLEEDQTARGSGGGTPSYLDGGSESGGPSSRGERVAIAESFSGVSCYPLSWYLCFRYNVT